MCPQNAGNAVSETQNSKYFQGACPRTPYNCVVTMASHSLKPWLRYWVRTLSQSESLSKSKAMWININANTVSKRTCIVWMAPSCAGKPNFKAFDARIELATLRSCLGGLPCIFLQLYGLRKSFSLISLKCYRV